MEERDFLARIRSRQPSSKERGTTALPPRATLGTTDFAASVEANGMSFRSIPTASLPEMLVASIGPAHPFVSWRTPLLAPVAARARQAGLVEIAYPPAPEDPRPLIEAARVGVVEADVAIAETGSLGLVTGPDRGLLAALLPRKVVVVLTADRLISSLDDLPRWFAERGRVNLSLISGPSRTGDVAQRHILGAHGPAEVEVVLCSG